MAARGDGRRRGAPGADGYREFAALVAPHWDSWLGTSGGGTAAR
ncbi:hypothetical protein ACFVH7_26915 [Kitasatospora indigofera]